MSKTKHIAVVGAGLVGSLMSLFLGRRGYKVSVFERRPDMRKHQAEGGRSINLALSSRGIKALDEVGLSQSVNESAVPMHGRTMHDEKGNLTFQPYGKQGQYINSVSRGDLNVVLMNEAERHGVEFFFGHRCAAVDFAKTEITYQTDVSEIHRKFDVILAADGAFSAVRGSMQFTERFNYSQSFIEHGYKEFRIPPGERGKFLIDKNTLHIWPRESFMLIALPNLDGSFTCTLFFPFVGSPSFESLQEPEAFSTFFRTTFPDVASLMPTSEVDFRNNPTSSLVTISCYPWAINHTLLLGDASHAVLPFYGQGMNAGFEDCRILNNLLENNQDDWDSVLPLFQKIRKPDTDAIAQLAMDNFVEMRDLVGDADFLLRKKIEARIHELYPQKWIPLYSMVTFHEKIGYAEAHAIGKKQKKIMDEVMNLPGISSTWPTLNFERLASQLGEV